MPSDDLDQKALEAAIKAAVHFIATADSGEKAQAGIMAAAIRAYLKALRSAGYAVVPVEPTGAMINAACKALSPGRRPTPNRVSVREKHAIRYRAMLTASGEE